MLSKISMLIALVAILVYNLVPLPFDEKVMAGKRVLVTGASMGIGEEIAYDLARMKAKIVVVARSKDKLDAVVKKCLELGAQAAFAISTDLSTKDEAIYKNVIETSVEVLGGLDMLVLNHVSTSGLIVRNWPDSFNLNTIVDQFYLNTFSYFALSNAGIPHLEKTGGNVVVVSSASGIISIGQTVGYSAMKHSLHGYFESLRSNLKTNSRDGVSITICVLGAIDTESMRTNTGKDLIVPPVSAEKTARAIIMGGQRRERTVFYPREVIFINWLYPLFPWLIEFLMRMVL